MKEIEIVDDPEIIKVIIEDTRSKILRLLRFRDMTISEIASILNKDISTIFRHIKKLEKHGLIKVTGERKMHNVPEKLYGRTVRTIILAPESYERNAFIKRYAEKRVINIKNALEKLGYHVESKDDLYKFILYLDELSTEKIENLQRDIDWNDLWRLREILTILSMTPEDIKKLRKIVHSPKT